MAFVLYAALIVACVVIANLGGTEEVFAFVSWVPFGDKIGHFVLMGGLAFLADRVAGRRSLVGVPLGPAVVTLLVVAEELSQMGLATRSFDLLDLAADLTGIALFTGLSRWLPARPTARHSEG